MAVLLLNRLARDVEGFGNPGPRPVLAQCSHDVLCLKVVCENSEGLDGTEAIIGSEAIDGRSIHDATLVARGGRRNLSCTARCGRHIAAKSSRVGEWLRRPMPLTGATGDRPLYGYGLPDHWQLGARQNPRVADSAATTDRRFSDCCGIARLSVRSCSVRERRR